MKIIPDKLTFWPSRYRYISYAIAMIVLSAFHLIAVNFLSISGVTPDLLLILCVWITISEGPMAGMLAGFLIGVYFDVITMGIIGTGAFAKTISAFISGFFYKEEKHDKIIKSPMFLLIVFIASSAHNFIFYLFYLAPSQMEFITFFLKFGIANSFYTSIFAIFAILFKIPKTQLKFLKRKN
jgi:rod shape-determining protein MreD